MAKTKPILPAIDKMLARKLRVVTRSLARSNVEMALTGISHIASSHQTELEKSVRGRRQLLVLWDAERVLRAMLHDLARLSTKEKAWISKR